ncbi:MAG: hypothetical protein ACXIT9_12325 [Nitritalea sp.]
MRYPLRFLLFLGCFFLADFALDQAFRSGLERYYGLRPESRSAILGHSHIMLGIDVYQLQEFYGRPVAKYAREGANVHDLLLMGRHLREQAPELERVFIGIDPWMFTESGLSENSAKLFYPFLNSPAVRAGISEQVESMEYLFKLLIRSSRYNELLMGSVYRGYTANWRNLKTGTLEGQDPERLVKNFGLRQIQSSPAMKETFEMLVEEFRQAGIEVHLVYTPTFYAFNAQNPEAFQAEIAYFQHFTAQQEGLHLHAFTEEWTREAGYFFDPIHLNQRGQAAVTQALIEALKGLK